MNDTCDDCGELLDDYSACACALGNVDRLPKAPDPRKARAGPPGFRANMRTMVDRKLRRQGKR